jgi:pSer/pThr/pTyr-binding forkhead associated (FHA) protein
VSHVYCPECGFQNPEASNYCSRCGALLGPPDPAAETQAMTPEELQAAEGAPSPVVEGPALVVRSGGGRAGESFGVRGEKMTIGRSPDCDVFLDDVTVSRKHAELLQEANDTYRIEDQGSLNGTFLNRRRIDSAPLENGDELQIGKYKLTFLSS